MLDPQTVFDSLPILLQEVRLPRPCYGCQVICAHVPQFNIWFIEAILYDGIDPEPILRVLRGKDFWDIVLTWHNSDGVIRNLSLAKEPAHA